MYMASAQEKSTQPAVAAAATQVSDLPEVCLAQAIALTSPLDACGCAAVSPAFRAAADSDQVWRTFLPHPTPASKASSRSSSSKDAYLALCDAANATAALDGSCRVWLERATGARCYALSARSLSLPWDDGEFCWRFTPHPRSRFAEVAEPVDCTCLDIYGTIPAAALTPATPYAAFLVYGTAERHRGLSHPDQEAAVAVGGQVVARHAVCLRPSPDDDDDRMTAAAIRRRRPCLRDDGWWEMELGRFVVSTPPVVDSDESETAAVVQASFEVLGWYPKHGLVVEGVEYRPLCPQLTDK